MSESQKIPIGKWYAFNVCIYVNLKLNMHTYIYVFTERFVCNLIDDVPAPPVMGNVDVLYYINDTAMVGQYLL